MKQITYIDEVEIKNKIVLLRVDFNVSLNQNYTIADDARIQQSLPTIKHLLKNNNQLIILSHLGRPKGVDEKFSLKIVVKRLKQYLPSYPIVLAKTLEEVKTKKEPIIVLENIRFFPKEKDYSTIFAKKLSSLADVYVNDAFGVCHRSDTSIIGPPKFIPGYGGLLLKKELHMLDCIVKKPKKPIAAIIGGVKVSTKIGLLERLAKLVDYLIIGGGLANTFLSAQGYKIGKSYCDYETTQVANHFLAKQTSKKPYILLPKDVVVGENKESKQPEIVKIEDIPFNKSIFDIGPETTAEIGHILAQAKTIIWNGPVGYFENPSFRRGTDFIYYSIAHNNEAISILGGGDTLAAISKKEYLNKITHISTGGGAMLELIEKGTLPGIEALKR
ncbi:phosphoglycerate kinase [Candidatus Roizmanbacteria bacterium CG22_combo_CG10-13_8_21_14_all_35_9]|uniref:Phosphoglycerate kinase n=3 Tax=Candidatus Roizmaniibacteriota TaxID=1752723 RepID=A0A2M8F3E2_9BACT|nr:MAG: phosphoglycerate kinase [Candidatus Roizmanbacteria bacterium CG22_combo_CG10-13_8_21_14_all_35_9]PIY71393.1 MAG: phosphoglycerate kinase [Candidatus Roizmanbacteria bacterium CG_4_10_14_0_8_um_filter_35_28]PJC33805.1 MAG: phosphoglycerate kinase [Candidatus Roizmanbacteria bacterium CG_4_9_14_0_2_um_filter_35_15]